MSSFTQNPFASSHSLDANPFEDPTPAQSTTTIPPSAYSADSTARLDDIARRERELEAREAELNQRAEHIRRHGRNNWPPFYPLIFHSIVEEIPEPSRPLITRLYQLWLALLVTLIVNLVACILILIHGSTDGGRDVGASIGYLPVISVLSFLLWYRPIYNGYMKEQSLYYYLYFFFGGFHILFSLYMFIGIPGTGSGGLIQTIEVFTQGGVAAGIVSIFASVGWALQTLGNGLYYRLIWRHHNEAGHSFNKAKAELASQGAKSYFTRG